jgi:hypothetical protein
VSTRIYRLVRGQIAECRRYLIRDGGSTWTEVGDLFAESGILGSRQWAGSAHVRRRDRHRLLLLQGAGEEGEDVQPPTIVQMLAEDGTATLMTADGCSGWPGRLALAETSTSVELYGDGTGTSLKVDAWTLRSIWSG